MMGSRGVLVSRKYLPDRFQQQIIRQCDDVCVYVPGNYRLKYNAGNYRLTNYCLNKQNVELIR